MSPFGVEILKSLRTDILEEAIPYLKARKVPVSAWMEWTGVADKDWLSGLWNSVEPNDDEKGFLECLIPGMTVGNPVALERKPEVVPYDSLVDLEKRAEQLKILKAREKTARETFATAAADLDHRYYSRETVEDLKRAHMELAAEVSNKTAELKVLREKQPAKVKACLSYERVEEAMKLFSAQFLLDFPYYSIGKVGTKAIYLVRSDGRCNVPCTCKGVCSKRCRQCGTKEHPVHAEERCPQFCGICSSETCPVYHKRPPKARIGIEGGWIVLYCDYGKHILKQPVEHLDDVSLQNPFESYISSFLSLAHLLRELLGGDVVCVPNGARNRTWYLFQTVSLRCMTKVWEPLTEDQLRVRVQPQLIDYLKKQVDFYMEDARPDSFTDWFSARDPQVADPKRDYATWKENNKVDFKEWEERNNGLISEINKRILSINLSGGMRYILNDLAGLVTDLTFIDKLDSNKTLVPFKGGKVYDIVSKTVRVRERTDYFSFEFPWNFDLETPKKSELLEKFFDDFMSGDKERVAFLKFYLGINLLGRNKFNSFFLFSDMTMHGCNGKSTFFNLMFDMIGRWMTRVNPSALEDEDTRNPELYKAARKKAIICSEVSPDKKISKTLVKRLSGGDKIIVRDNHGTAESTKEIDAVMTFVMQGTPSFDKIDGALLGRILIFECETYFVGPRASTPPAGVIHFRKGDVNIGETLRAREHMEAMFDISLRQASFACDVKEIEPLIPKKCLEARANYAQEKNLVLQFLRQKCTLSLGAARARNIDKSTTSETLMKAYNEFVGHDDKLSSRTFKNTFMKSLKELPPTIMKEIIPDLGDQPFVETEWYGKHSSMYWFGISLNVITEVQPLTLL